MTKTKSIFKLTAPYTNESQGPATRVLFVCSVGMLRSPTAAVIGAKLGLNTRSCGSSNLALIPLSVNLIMWADWIVFMNRENYNEARDTFQSEIADNYLFDKAVVWDIPDHYNYMDERLVFCLESAVKELA